MAKFYKLVLGSIIPLLWFASLNCYANEVLAPLSDTLVENQLLQIVPISKAEEKKIEKEKKIALKEEQKKQREAQRAKDKEERRKNEITFDEFVANWRPLKKTDNEFIDNFCSSSEHMLFSYKQINDSINFIKIETFEIPDSGDGVTTAVKITDGNGNPRTAASISAKWTAISLNIVSFSFQATNMILSSAGFIMQVIEDPIEAISLLGAISQLRQATQALKLLTREMAKTNILVKQQKALLETCKVN